MRTGTLLCSTVWRREGYKKEPAILNLLKCCHRQMSAALLWALRALENQWELVSSVEICIKEDYFSLDIRALGPRQRIGHTDVVALGWTCSVLQCIADMVKAALSFNKRGDGEMKIDLSQNPGHASKPTLNKICIKSSVVQIVSNPLHYKTNTDCFLT